VAKRKGQIEQRLRIYIEEKAPEQRCDLP